MIMMSTFHKTVVPPVEDIKARKLTSLDKEMKQILGDRNSDTAQKASLYWSALQKYLKLHENLRTVYIPQENEMSKQQQQPPERTQTIFKPEKFSSSIEHVNEILRKNQQPKQVVIPKKKEKKGVSSGSNTVNCHTFSC